MHFKTKDLSKLLILATVWSGACTLGWAGPYLPPVEHAESTVPSSGSTDTVSVGATSQQEGMLFSARQRLVREYERNTIGYTRDEGDSGFFDFKASLMFPLLHTFYPDRLAEGETFNHWRPFPYAAATVEGGQYIGGRKSSPVVGKRFNPLLSARWWLPTVMGDDGTPLDRFVEFVVAHESNGQWIENETTFNENYALHLADMQRGTFAEGRSEAELQRLARAEARDEISRGWDYVGVNFRWAASLVDSPRWQERLTFSAKLHHYVVLLQDRLEEYEQWENVPGGKKRDRVDGVYLHVNYEFDRVFGSKSILQVDSQVGVIWRTGIGSPFKYNTWEFELGGTLVNLPVVFWYRTGYNSDFIDYFRADESYGIRVIVEGF